MLTKCLLGSVALQHRSRSKREQHRKWVWLQLVKWAWSAPTRPCISLTNQREVETSSRHQIRQRICYNKLNGINGLTDSPVLENLERDCEVVLPARFCLQRPGIRVVYPVSLTSSRQYCACVQTRTVTCVVRMRTHVLLNNSAYDLLRGGGRAWGRGYEKTWRRSSSGKC